MTSILLVESDKARASAATVFLEGAGYSVTTASTGQDAAVVCGRSPSCVDVIMMDMELGAGMDGIETAELILREFDLPIVFTYVGSDRARFEKAAALLAYGFVPKEASIDAYCASITSALRLHKICSERQRSEIARMETERLHRDLIEKMPDGVYKSTHEGKFIEVNPAMVRILGYASKEELYAIDIKTQLYFAAADRESAALEEKLEEMAVFRLKKKDGSEVWVEDHGSHVVDDDGTVLYHEGILRDVTERVRSERQLLQAQKLEGIGTLAGGIAHDFNNLLAMILGSAELLSKQTAGAPDLKKYVDRIIDASERGASISRQLLIFSRPNQAELKPVSLSHLILELDDLLKHFLPKSITIETKTEAESGIIMGDSGQIHQALLNLAINASDAMSGRGTMVIRECVADAAAMREKYPAQRIQPYIGVSISDTGVGMEPSVLGKIFDPFFSTKERGKGTGLGLAIVHGIVKNHHGFIDVESAPGKGTTFTLYFPLAAAMDGTEMIASAAAPGAATGTILLVDDEPMIREMLTEFLEESGFVVMPAVNGAEAIRLYEKYSILIDLVITDLGMPEMGGEELFQRLREFDEHVNVIVSSGYLDGSTKADLMDSGVKDVLTKPYKFEEILRVIREVLHA